MKDLGDKPIEEWGKEYAAVGREVLLWHDTVHERRESSQLYFWRLAFSPRYPKEEIFEGLAHFYTVANINSYVVYETLGDYDLLLRVWAPRSYNAEELELLLRQSLQGCYLWNLNYLGCRTELHFSDNESKSQSPPSDHPQDTVGASLIEAINEYNERQAASLFESDRDLTSYLERPEGVEALIEDGTVRSVPLDTRGIRMFITFDHPRQPLRPETRARAVEELKKKCREVRESWVGETEVDGSGNEVPIQLPNISIYAGAGSMTDFLVIARAPHKHFHAFVRQLIHGIRQLGLDELYEMRPYTHVISDRMFSAFREYRSVGNQVDDVEGLVDQEESEALEFKATLMTNFRSSIVAGRDDADPAMTDEVVRAVSGFLNSPDGGTLVLGVLETRNELSKARNPGRYLAVLEERFGYESVEGPSEVQPNAVVGIEVDIEAGHFKNSDEYSRALGDLLKSRITPTPWPWLRIELRRLAGKTLCLVSVRPGDVWFYATQDDPRGVAFFVRQGASTPALIGPESDLYKRVHPRGLTSFSPPGE
ncbi:MAG TPA: ATP-binding protein [Solirubrobacterales bacterium]|nr:ATP-binding protein [Solirubrobacterales bacterium]